MAAASPQVRNRHVTAIPLGRRLPGASSNLPGRPIADTRSRFCLAARLAPSLFGLAPGGVCRAAFVAEDAVRSYRTFSPLPAFALAGSGGRFVLCGTVPEIGAPRGSLLSPDVIRHRMSMEPGLSSRAAFRRLHERPSGRLTQNEVGGFGSKIKQGWPAWLLNRCEAKAACGPACDRREAVSMRAPREELMRNWLRSAKSHCKLWASVP